MIGFLLNMSPGPWLLIYFMPLDVSSHTSRHEAHAQTPRLTHWWLSLLRIPYVDTSTWEAVAHLACYAYKAGVLVEELDISEDESDDLLEEDLEDVNDVLLDEDGSDDDDELSEEE
jgi:hypothetical protein